MKRIVKTHPPTELTAYIRDNPEQASYGDCPTNIKDKWSEVLLLEQGYLCAYSMERISTGYQKMKREHIAPQNDTAGNDLNHYNVVAVSMGNEGQPIEKQYADSRKGNRVLKYISPLHDDCERSLYYRKNGEIDSRDENVRAEIIDFIKADGSRNNSLLNLNEQVLVLKRKAAYDAVIRFLDKEGWKKRHIEDLISKYEQKKDGYYQPFCNFVLYHLYKFLKKMN